MIGGMAVRTFAGIPAFEQDVGGAAPGDETQFATTPR